MSSRATRQGKGLAAPSRLKTVAVSISVDAPWKRKVFSAIAEYSQQAGWNLLFSPRGDDLAAWASDSMAVDGVIALLEGRDTLQAIETLRAPVVDLGDTAPIGRKIARVTTDAAALSNQAFEHFRERMYSNFAVCYCEQASTAPRFAPTFVKVANATGFECASSPLAATPGNGDPAMPYGPALIQWLLSLPKPVGIFAEDAMVARNVAAAAISVGLRVPSDIAILTAEDDELLCEALRPSISSVVQANHQIGRLACQVLADMMADPVHRPGPKYVASLGISTRHSTDYVAIQAPNLTAVVRTIWSRCGEGLQVLDLVKQSGMSRRTLEHRFHKLLGYSPAEAIRRAKLEKARRMVLMTSKTVSTIATACGFATGPYFSQVFKRYYGVTPSSLRQELGVADRP